MHIFRQCLNLVASLKQFTSDDPKVGKAQLFIAEMKEQSSEKQKYVRTNSEEMGIKPIISEIFILNSQKAQGKHIINFHNLLEMPRDSLPSSL